MLSLYFNRSVAINTLIFFTLACCGDTSADEFRRPLTVSYWPLANDSKPKANSQEAPHLTSSRVISNMSVEKGLMTPAGRVP